MSTGERIPLAAADALAARVVLELGPCCERIEVGGSVRRRRPDVGDLEIVAIPRMTMAGTQSGLFGPTGEQVSELWRELDRLVADGAGWAQAPGSVADCPRCKGAGGYTSAKGDTVCERCHGSGLATRAAPWGERYRQALYRGRQVDLFTTRPETWGALLLIRTGPSAFSRAWVTALREVGLRMEDGRVTDTGSTVPCPDEETAFALTGWAWRPPEART